MYMDPRLAVRIENRNEIVYFCSEQCKKKFLQAPRDERVPSSEVLIGDIVPNPQQPRTVMDPEQLAELSESIKMYGIIQPLLVTQEVGQDGRTVYQLIAGERRLRAAKAAGLERVPVTIRQTTPQELLEIANVMERLERAYALMEGEIGVMQVEKRIRNRVKRQMEKTQR